MTSTATVLSIEKTATLLRNLVDLGNQTNVGFPSIIEEYVSELLDAQTIFVNQIDQYMHRREHDVNEVETVRVIIEACPEFLTTKNGSGKLPIFSSAHDYPSSSIFVPLLAKAGHQHGIGGLNGRGGLLMDDSRGFNTLQYLTSNPSADTFKALMSTEPPLFQKQDVRDHQLLHFAVVHKQIENVKLMIELDASCIYHCNGQNQIPICHSYFAPAVIDKETKIRELEIVRYLLQTAIKYDAHHPSIGGLFRAGTDNEGLVLSSIISKFGRRDTWDCIEQALSRFDNLPILHQTILHAPQHCITVMTHFPDSVFLRDKRNRLPIHVALASGMSWSSNLVAIINANRPHLKDRDPLTGWPPFTLAAMEPSCGLKTAYYLLMKNPEQAEKFDVENLESSPKVNSKGKKRGIDEL
jgi:hypothetical protein